MLCASVVVFHVLTASICADCHMCAAAGRERVLPAADLSSPGSSPGSPRAGAGSAASGGSIFEGGLFDRGSWTEAQAGWARSVVTGRARLGGISVGVVAVETQTVHKAVPADPGMPDSSEVTIPQAGQVRWLVLALSAGRLQPWVVAAAACVLLYSV